MTANVAWKDVWLSYKTEQFGASLQLAEKGLLELTVDVKGFNKIKHDLTSFQPSNYSDVGRPYSGSWTGLACENSMFFGLIDFNKDAKEFAKNLNLQAICKWFESGNSIYSLLIIDAGIQLKNSISIEVDGLRTIRLLDKIRKGRDLYDNEREELEKVPWLQTEVSKLVVERGDKLESQPAATLFAIVTLLHKKFLGEAKPKRYPNAWYSYGEAFARTTVDLEREIGEEECKRRIFQLLFDFCVIDEVNAAGVTPLAAWYQLIKMAVTRGNVLIPRPFLEGIQNSHSSKWLLSWANHMKTISKNADDGYLRCWMAQL